MMYLVCVFVCGEGALFSLPQYKLEITKALKLLNIVLIFEVLILPLQRRFPIKVPGSHVSQDTTYNSQNNRTEVLSEAWK